MNPGDLKISDFEGFTREIDLASDRCGNGWRYMTVIVNPQTETFEFRVFHLNKPPRTLESLETAIMAYNEVQS